MLALTILGNNSAIPAWDRNPTAHILQSLDECYLIDCGEGTQIQMSKYKIRRSRLNHIFISHLHGDHYFGLIGLLTSFSLLGRTQDLHLHAPAALEQIIKLQFSVADVKLSYPFYFHAITTEGIIVNDTKITVESFKVRHRIECWGFLFIEKKNLRKIDSERIKAYEIPKTFYEKLQKGEDYITKKGTIIPNEEVTIAGIKPKSYAYCADTIYDETLIDKIKSGVKLFPIVVNTEMKILDGNHRLVAYKKLGYKEIEIYKTDTAMNISTCQKKIIFKSIGL